MPVTLSPSQQSTCNAFRAFIQDKHKKEFLISGFAGSGKSFLVEYLVKMSAKEFKLEQLINDKAIERAHHFTATTNKAAYVLSNMLCKPAKTIHRLLGLSMQKNFNKGTVELIKKNDPVNLDNSIIYVDESSMITRELLHYIQKSVAKWTNCKVVYIGDSYQLPPVKETICPIFQTNINVHFLSEIQRQVKDSPIIKLSTKYREMLNDHTLTWPVVTSNEAITHYTNESQWFDAIKAAYSQTHHPDAVRILAWDNARIREYNSWIRNFMGQTGDFALNEVVQSNKPLMSGNKIMAHTDSVHQIIDIDMDVVNNIPGYTIKLSGIHSDTDVIVFQPRDWKAANTLASSYAKQAKAEKDSDQRAILWRRFFEIKEGWADLRPVHAQTVHKSQGSTYDEVFVDLSNIGRNNKWQEVARLVYVAITRASQHVHLFGKLQERYTKAPIINHMETFKNVTPNIFN